MQSKLKILGGAAFGAWVGFFVFVSVVSGLRYTSYQEEQDWGIVFFWGEHWFMRLVFSLMATLIGGLFAGVAAPGHGRIAGTLSAIPTCLLWLGMGLLKLLGTLQATIVPISLGSWAVIIVITVASPYVGMISGQEGELWRSQNQELFGKRGRWLGLYWHHWLWLWIPYYFLLSNFAIFGDTLIYLISHNPRGLILSIIAGGFISFSAFGLGYAAYYTINVLMVGESQGLSPGKVARQVIGCLVVIPVLSVTAYLIGLSILAMKEKLPWWLPL